MPVTRSGYRALVNAVWGLVAGGLPVASRTVTAASVTAPVAVASGTIDLVGTVNGNVNGHLLGNVGGNVNGSVGSVAGTVGGNLLGHVNGNVQGWVNGHVAGSVLTNVFGSVGSVVAPVTVAVGSPGTIRRKFKGATVITDQNTSQTTALGVNVVELLTHTRFLGSTRINDTLTDDASVELLDSGNVRVYRSAINNQSTVRWELTEYWG
jgi:hypothetical protein